MRRTVLIATTLLLLMVVNFTIYQRENLISNGRMVLLELAPVDPRSLMQGDYMALRFQMANQAMVGQRHKMLADGCLIAVLDERGIATFSRFDDSSPLAKNEVLLRYRIRNGRPKFATDAFFFQEGDAEKYETARFGEFSVDRDGEAILIRLRDKDLTILGDKDLKR